MQMGRLLFVMLSSWEADTACSSYWFQVQVQCNAVLDYGVRCNLDC